MYSVNVAFVICFSFALAGCGRAAPDTNDVLCLKRSDLRLAVATLNRDQREVESSLQEGADANASIEGLAPPIVIAALTDSYGAVKLLLDKGANINARDNQGYTPLITACLNNCIDDC